MAGLLVTSDVGSPSSMVAATSLVPTIASPSTLVAMMSTSASVAIGSSRALVTLLSQEA